MNAIEEPLTRRRRSRRDLPGADEALVETREANSALLAAGLRAQQEAEQATSGRGQLEALVSGLAEGVIVLDGSGAILLLNPAAREILDLPTTQVGDAWHFLSVRNVDGLAVVGDDERPGARALRGERFTDVESLLVPDRGRPRRCLFSGNSVLDTRGNVEMAIITVRDITAIRNLEQLREDYVSLISHDLRSPLSVVVAAAERLSRQFSKDREDEIHEVIDLITESATRMNTMITDLMEAASLEAGQITLEKEPVAIDSLIAAVVNRIATTTSRPIDYARAEHPLVPISGDAAMIERVVANLLTNALKYSEANTPVLVSVDPGAEEVTVSVRDIGRGIAPVAQALVFDRFYRVRENVDQTTGGYGLGLYICRLVVEAHGGRIWVESEQGVGSTFRFTLPVTPTNGE